MNTKYNNRDNVPLLTSLHIRFFKYFLQVCPASLAEQDLSRLTIAFFSISGIDVLNGLDTLTPEFKNQCIEWIYHLQVLPQPNDSSDKPRICGFQGASANIVKNSDHTYETSHLAMTYTGLCSLLILGDDLSRVDRRSVIDGVRKLQLPNGSFCATRDTEADMRFIYCAACISYILNDFSGINLESMVKYILDSVTYDGGLAQGPGLESHGGSTYCAVAALKLTNSLNALSLFQVERLKRWCIMRQQEGFQGRPNKPEDTCYSFWVGGTLALLGASEFVNASTNRAFVMSTQDSTRGGFAKWPDSLPDSLHAFLGLAGLSLQGEEGLASLEPLLCITERAHTYLKQLQSQW